MKRRAFTLIELMVVIGIVVIITAITLPAVKMLTRGNGEKQAVNLLTAMLANARANALASHNVAGLVLYEDPASKGMTSIQLIGMTSSGYEPTGKKMAYYFGPFNNTGPQSLPGSIHVASISDSSTTFVNSGEDTSPNARIILFDENGQLLLRNRLYRDPSLTDARSAAWNFSTSFSSNGSDSNPGVMIYDENNFQAAVDKATVSRTNSTQIYQWMQQNADILLINAYTGNIIRTQ